jgi:hypothetical protein
MLASNGFEISAFNEKILILGLQVLSLKSVIENTDKNSTLSIDWPNQLVVEE